jgi:zinc protease
MVALFLASAAVAAEFKLNVSEFKMDNGLTVLLLENHAAPVITYYTFFKVGSRNEHPGITGISHFFEHMMFNGAKKYGVKMFDKMLESRGGYSNAYTNQNITAYYDDFASDNLELVIDMEADRLGTLAFDPEVMKSEIGVVKEERMLRTDNDNGGLLEEELYASAYMAHPYSWPVIGWMADLSAITRDDCLKYHATYYAPNNATVIIVGDFQTAKATELIKKYYKDIPAGTPPPAVVRDEPEQRGPRRTVVEKPGEFVNLMRGYHVGDKDSPDLYTLEVAQSVLTSGESSRMYQSLVNDLALATQVYSSYDWGFDPSLFYFYVAAVPGKNADAVEKAFDSVLTAFIATGPTADELTRAKNSLTANFYKNYKTTNGTSHQLGYYQTFFGDYKKMYDYPVGVAKVTADDVKQAAAKYFTRQNSTTAVLIPEGGAQ